MKLSQYIVFFYLILCPQLVYYSLGEKVTVTADTLKFFPDEIKVKTHVSLCISGQEVRNGSTTTRKTS